MVAPSNLKWFARLFVRLHVYVLLLPLAVISDCIEMTIRWAGVSVSASRACARLGASALCIMFCYFSILSLGWNTQIINSQHCELSYVSLPCSVTSLSINVALLAAQVSRVALDMMLITAQICLAVVVHPGISLYIMIFSIAIVLA